MLNLNKFHHLKAVKKDLKHYQHKDYSEVVEYFNSPDFARLIKQCYTDTSKIAREDYSISIMYRLEQRNVEISRKEALLLLALGLGVVNPETLGHQFEVTVEKNMDRDAQEILKQLGFSYERAINFNKGQIFFRVSY